MARAILTLEERFMQYVEPEPNSGCWLWTSAVDRAGYGRFTPGVGWHSPWRRKTMRAHRFAYAHFRGGELPKLHVLHSCDCPSCVNPAHLFLGTDKDNNADKMRKNRGRKSAAGLPFGVNFERKSKRNPYSAKVTIRGVCTYIGCFKTAEEAGMAAKEFREDRIAAIEAEE